jgi:Na+-transporting NADH:ubiquinone oxidoreductase subunit NqrA
MGYMASWNANKVVDLEQQETPTAEQIGALQLTEEELIAVPCMVQSLKLELISSVAARPEQMELFQFYRLRVPL